MLPLYHVPLHKPKGAFKPCRWCHGEYAKFDHAPEILPANHAAKVICEECGRQIAWASARQVRKAGSMTPSPNHPITPANEGESA